MVLFNYFLTINLFIALFIIWCIFHVYPLPRDGSVFLHMHTHQVVAWLGVVGLAHRVEGQVLNTAHNLLVPLMNMAHKHNVGFPFIELIEQEKGLLAREGRCEL